MFCVPPPLQLRGDCGGATFQEVNWTLFHRCLRIVLTKTSYKRQLRPKRLNFSEVNWTLFHNAEMWSNRPILANINLSTNGQFILFSQINANMQINKFANTKGFIFQAVPSIIQARVLQIPAAEREQQILDLLKPRENMN